MCIAPRYENYPDAIDTGARINLPVMGADSEVGYFHTFQVNPNGPKP